MSFSSTRARTGHQSLELLRIAGREAGSDAFEAKVLAELAAICSGIERLERTVVAARR